MAIKHIVTRGYGFADGTIYIPTRGYSSGAAETSALTFAVLDKALSLDELDKTLSLIDRPSLTFGQPT